MTCFLQCMKMLFLYGEGGQKMGKCWLRNMCMLPKALIIIQVWSRNKIILKRYLIIAWIRSKCNAEWQVLCFMMKNMQYLWYSKLRLGLTAATRSHGKTGSHGTNQEPNVTSRNLTATQGTAWRFICRNKQKYLIFIRQTSTQLCLFNINI